jgi:uncharacterized membrane protein
MSQETNFEDKFSELNNTKDSTSEFSQQDINSNKVMAILAYLGILVLVPIFAAKDSKFARFHANQGLVLFLAEIAFYIVLTIVSAIILAISWKLYFIITILSLVWIVFLVLAIIGIINAANGRAKELPVIGKYKVLK